MATVFKGQEKLQDLENISAWVCDVLAVKTMSDYAGFVAPKNTSHNKEVNNHKSMNHLRDKCS